MGVPQPLDDASLPAGAMNCRDGEAAEVVVITEELPLLSLEERLSPAQIAAAPIISACSLAAPSTFNRYCDAQIGAATRESLARAIASLAPMISRQRRLSLSILTSDDPRFLVLGHMFVRNSDVVPLPDPTRRSAFVYLIEGRILGAVSAAEELSAAGLLEKEFFDSLAVCPHCGSSARMVIRERCTACGSADLSEEPVLHHLSCAYQGPESDFRGPKGHLTCPKCRQPLSFFSLDYDRPGSLYICRTCTHSSSQAIADYNCLGCGNSIGVGHLGRRDYFAYRLTEAGRTMASSPRIQIPSAPTAEDAVRSFAERMSSYRRGGCILEITLQEHRGIPVNGRSWRQTWTFFHSLLRECFVHDTQIVERAPAFLVLIENDGKHDVEDALPEIRNRLEAHLSLPLTIRYVVRTPSEYLDNRSER
jgi:hypothetical protein